MQLFLIRHAQSQNNALPEEERVEDPAITEIGREQARRLAVWAPSLRLTKLYTSPFLRALETTTPICGTTALLPRVLVDLHEQGGCYGGHLPESIVGRPGMTRAEIEERFTGFHAGDEIDGDGWWASKPHETEAAARRRAGRLLRWVHGEFAETDERVALVMHANFKLLFLEQFHAAPLDVPANASVTEIEFASRGTRLKAFSTTEHLPAELITF